MIMCLFQCSIKLLVIFFLSVCCTNIHGFTSNRELNSEAISFKNENEDSEWYQKKEQEFPIAILAELNDPVLECIKKFWGKQNTTALSLTKTTLATFDSSGLQKKYQYTDSHKFLQAIQELTEFDTTKTYECPTMHVLDELIQKDLSNGSILLLTGTKPLDEEISGIVAETLISKKCQLSVLWCGDKNPEQFAQLKELALKSGGKFGFFAQELNDENMVEARLIEEPNLRKKISPQVLSSVKFPEANESVPKVSAAVVSKQRTIGNVLPIIVEVASGANLESRPGNQIPFTVKNTISVPLAVVFGAKLDDVPQIIQPQRLTLQPSQTETIKVHLQPNPNTQPSASSILTFTVFGPTRQYSRSAIISPLPLNNNDRKEPYLKHRYDGDCSQFNEPHSCENSQWSLEITVHDEDSGLLKVISEPSGLLFQTEFLAGTKQQITAYYTASCCQPKVDIWAEDLKGNHVKKSYDVINQTLLAGEIAAIVVGVILLVFLIIAIIIGVTLYKRRNRRNLVIPRTAGGSR